MSGAYPYTQNYQSPSRGGASQASSQPTRPPFPPMRRPRGSQQLGQFNQQQVFQQQGGQIYADPQLPGASHPQHSYGLNMLVNTHGSIGHTVFPPDQAVGNGLHHQQFVPDPPSMPNGNFAPSHAPNTATTSGRRTASKKRKQDAGPADESAKPAPKKRKGALNAPAVEPPTEAAARQLGMRTATMKGSGQSQDWWPNNRPAIDDYVNHAMDFLDRAAVEAYRKKKKSWTGDEEGVPDDEDDIINLVKRVFRALIDNTGFMDGIKLNKGKTGNKLLDGDYDVRVIMDTAWRIVEALIELHTNGTYARGSTADPTLKPGHLYERNYTFSERAEKTIRGCTENKKLGEDVCERPNEVFRLIIAAPDWALLSRAKNLFGNEKRGAILREQKAKSAADKLAETAYETMFGTGAEAFNATQVDDHQDDLSGFQVPDADSAESDPNLGGILGGHPGTLFNGRQMHSGPPFSDMAAAPNTPSSFHQAADATQVYGDPNLAQFGHQPFIPHGHTAHAQPKLTRPTNDGFNQYTGDSIMGMPPADLAGRPQGAIPRAPQAKLKKTPKAANKKATRTEPAIRPNAPLRPNAYLPDNLDLDFDDQEYTFKSQGQDMDKWMKPFPPTASTEQPIQNPTPSTAPNAASPDGPTVAVASGGAQPTSGAIAPVPRPAEAANTAIAQGTKDDAASALADPTPNVENDGRDQGAKAELAAALQEPDSAVAADDSAEVPAAQQSENPDDGFDDLFNEPEEEEEEF